MQKYYICTTAVAKGPFLLEELYKIEVGEQDLIWASKWRSARYANEVAELKKHFREKWAMQHGGKRWSLLVKWKKLLFSAGVSVLIVLILYYAWPD